MNNILWKPQPAQARFLRRPEYEALYGGAAGGGKSEALIIEALRQAHIPHYRALILRKSFPELSELIGKSFRYYPYAFPGARYQENKHCWHFPSGAVVEFGSMNRPRDRFKYQGRAWDFIAFDELTHFSEKTFFYMFSRNRSLCGVRPYTRATCNPDADSWVAKFIEWWIDPDTGYPIPERSGKIRWFIRIEEVIHWADTREKLWEQFNLATEAERNKPKSVSFIAASVYDNKALMEKDPGYLSNLEAMPLVERERLLHGNWKIKAAAGLYFKRTQVGKMLPNVPLDVVRWVRAWDLAATSEDEGGEPAYTAGVLMGKRVDGRYVVADVINVRLSAADVRKTVKMTAASDRARFKRIRIRLPKDPGQAGKDQAQSYIRYMAGFDVCAVAETGSKEARAEPVAAQWQAGNFDVVIGDWNEEYFSQLESFPISKFKDMVDATSSGFAELENAFDIGGLIR